jgi:hypothetical protein
VEEENTGIRLAPRLINDWSGKRKPVVQSNRRPKSPETSLAGSSTDRWNDGVRPKNQQARGNSRAC